MKKNKLVTVKIHNEVRNLAKQHSGVTGMKMYKLIEEAIRQFCTQPQKMKVR